MGTVELGLATWLTLPAQARFGKRTRTVTGSHIERVSREDWPAAIAPFRVQVIDKGVLVLTDDFGHLAVADLSRRSRPRILAEIAGLGPRLVEFGAVGGRGFAVVSGGDAQRDPEFWLVTISLLPASKVAVTSRVRLPDLSEVTSLAVGKDVIAVGGVDAGQGNMVALYNPNARRGHRVEPAYMASFTVGLPIVRMNLEDRRLAVLQCGQTSQVDYVDLTYPDSPNLLTTVKLNGCYRVMCRFKDSLMVIGQDNGATGLEIKSLDLEPAPHAVASVSLGNLTAVADAACQKGRFLVLGERDSEAVLLAFSYDRSLVLTRNETITLAGDRGVPSGKCQIALSGDVAYVTDSVSGVEVLRQSAGSWNPWYKYAIPPLPACALVLWKELLLVGGSDLKLYDISRVDRPRLLASCATGGTVRSLVGLAGYVICLSGNLVSLRRMSEPGKILDSIGINGRALAVDQDTAYVLTTTPGGSTVSPIKIASDRLVAGHAWELTSGYRLLAASGGHLALAGLNDIELYDLRKMSQPVAVRRFDNLAIRDLAMNQNILVATVIDRQGNGSVLTLTIDGASLQVLGTERLPQDGVALDLSGLRASTVGRTAEGADLLSLIDLSVPTSPRLIASYPVVGQASAAAMKEDLAIVVGRGLEILRVS